ncbi:MAG: hypothetical protein GY789_26545 [Hyphomicrobiales bacterium]|nr:hypothetical protein [Hyphomicrobiales bacterium]MCP5000462.1 hypothetical protein [Hyphomicrobiales bacterium]
MRKITIAPEFNVAVFSFLLNFVWEYIQAPTYAGMIELNHWDGIKLCTSATFGDVGFALTAFWGTSLVARSRQWICTPSAFQVLVFLAVGIALTVGFEYYYTNISLRWTYSELMPLVPPFGTGFSPLLQWIVVPLLVIWFTRRQIRGAGPDSSDLGSGSASLPT